MRNWIFSFPATPWAPCCEHHSLKNRCTQLTGDMFNWPGKTVTHTICNTKVWLGYRLMKAVGQVFQSLLKKLGSKFSKSYLQHQHCVCRSDRAALLEHNVAYIKPAQGECDVSFKSWKWKVYFNPLWYRVQVTEQPRQYRFLSDVLHFIKGGGYYVPAISVIWSINHIYST